MDSNREEQFSMTKFAKSYFNQRNVAGNIRCNLFLTIGILELQIIFSAFIVWPSGRSYNSVKWSASYRILATTTGFIACWTLKKKSNFNSLSIHKSYSFGLLRVPFVNCCQFMYLVLSLLVLRAGYWIWLYPFLIIAYYNFSGGLEYRLVTDTNLYLSCLFKLHVIESHTIFKDVRCKYSNM